MKRAFTLIELLIVLVVIAILATLTLPVYQKYIESSKMAEAYMHLGAIKRAQQMFFQDEGKYAEDMSELDIDLVPQGARNFLYSTDADTGITDPPSCNDYIVCAHPDTNRPGMASITSHPHLHPTGGIGLWKSAAVAHSHGDYSHTHDINYGNPF